MEIKEKTVADSVTTQVQILMPKDMNGQARLFGGKLMEWIDVVAAVVARRHSQSEVTTASVDSLVFSAPAYQSDTLFMEGKLTYVGRTSMEVRVQSFTENRHGERALINTAFVVLVAIDKDDHPIEVPRLKLISKAEEDEFVLGMERAKMRKAKR